MALSTNIFCWVLSCLLMLWAPKMTRIRLQRNSGLVVGMSCMSCAEQVKAQGSRTATEGNEETGRPWG